MASLSIETAAGDVTCVPPGLVSLLMPTKTLTIVLLRGMNWLMAWFSWSAIPYVHRIWWEANRDHLSKPINVSVLFTWVHKPWPPPTRLSSGGEKTRSVSSSCPHFGDGSNGDSQLLKWDFAFVTCSGKTIPETSSALLWRWASRNPDKGLAAFLNESWVLVDLVPRACDPDTRKKNEENAQHARWRWAQAAKAAKELQSFLVCVFLELRSPSEESSLVYISKTKFSKDSSFKLCKW